MKRLLLAMSAAVLVAACGAGSDPTSTDASPSASATALSSEASAPAPELPDGAAPFNSSADFSPQIGLKVGAPSTCDMSEDDEVNQQLSCVVVKITVTNHTDAPLGLYSLTASMTSGGQDAGEVYAPSQGITGTRDLDKVAVPIGKSHSFDLGFAVQDSTNLILDIGSSASGQTFRYATPS